MKDWSHFSMDWMMPSESGRGIIFARGLRCQLGFSSQAFKYDLKSQLGLWRRLFVSAGILL